MRFTDRRDAGRQLAARLRELAGPDVVVLGLPRGGVPVAAEVASALDIPISTVMTPQVSMMRAIHQRAPTRSSSRLLGTSNRK